MSQRDILYAIVHLYIDLTRALGGQARPERPERFGADATLLLIRAAVYIGTIDGRPLTATKLADYLGLPRATVIRKLQQLVQRGAIEREDGHYCTPRRRLDQIDRGDLADLVKLIQAAAQRLTNSDGVPQ
jgi:DNA-binding MarR family transcriptional regulator